MKTKKPYFKFWVDNWRSDPQLRKCSYAARGLWIELLCLMHENEPYGYLGLTPGVNPSSEIARVTGGAYQTVSALLSDLVTAGVCGVTSEGVIFSRKMVRDHEKSLKGQEVGKTGGNPALQKGLTQGLTTEVKPHSPESKIKKEDAPSAQAAPAPMAPPVGGCASPPPPPVPPPPSPAIYAFERGRVRFTRADYADLEKSFRYIDVTGALMALANLCVDKNDWHGFILNALAKRNQVAKERIELEKAKQPVRPIREHID